MRVRPRGSAVVQGGPRCGHRPNWLVGSPARGAGQSEPDTLGPGGGEPGSRLSAGRSAPGSGRSWPGARVWRGDEGETGWAGLGGAAWGGASSLQPRRPRSPSPGSVSAPAARRSPPAAAAALNMEPPDARAGARRARRLLVLVVLLAAQPGMARAESRARLGGAGRGCVGTGVHRPQGPQERRDMGVPLPVRDTATARQRAGDLRLCIRSDLRSRGTQECGRSAPCPLRR